MTERLLRNEYFKEIFEGRERSPGLWGNIDNFPGNPSLIVVDSLIKRRLPIFKKPAVDFKHRPLDKMVAIHAEPKAQRLINRINNTPELRVIRGITMVTSPLNPDRLTKDERLLLAYRFDQEALFAKHVSESVSREDVSGYWKKREELFRDIARKYSPSGHLPRLSDMKKFIDGIVTREIMASLNP